MPTETLASAPYTWADVAASLALWVVMLAVGGCLLMHYAACLIEAWRGWREEQRLRGVVLPRGRL